MTFKVILHVAIFTFITSTAIAGGHNFVEQKKFDHPLPRETEPIQLNAEILKNKVTNQSPVLDEKNYGLLPAINTKVVKVAPLVQDTKKIKNSNVVESENFLEKTGIDIKEIINSK